MSAVIRIKPSQLKTMLMREHHRVKRALTTASRRAARRFQAAIVNRIDEMGITDLGGYKGSWRVRNTAESAEVYSDCPYGGIIELGARPHPVSKEGREAIARWAHRKLGVDMKTAMSIAWVVAQKIKTEGQKPRYVVRDLLPKARAFFAQEMVSILNNRSRAST